MQKRGILLILIVAVLAAIISGVSASEIDSEIQKITSYAQEYEIGNINYVQLILHLSSSREKMQLIKKWVEFLKKSD